MGRRRTGDPAAAAGRVEWPTQAALAVGTGAAVAFELESEAAPVAARFPAQGIAALELPVPEYTDFALAETMLGAVGKGFALVLAGRVIARNRDSRRKAGHTLLVQEGTVCVGQDKAPRDNRRYTRDLVHVVDHNPGTQTHMAGDHTPVVLNGGAHRNHTLHHEMIEIEGLD